MRIERDEVMLMLAVALLVFLGAVQDRLNVVSVVLPLMMLVTAGYLAFSRRKV